MREAYALVGVTERMEASLWVLSQQLPSWFATGAQGRADGHAARLNAAASGSQLQAARQLTPVRLQAALRDDAAASCADFAAALSRRQAVAAQLRALNGYDWRLYVMARALLERHLAACEAESGQTAPP